MTRNWWLLAWMLLIFLVGWGRPIQGQSLYANSKLGQSSFFRDLRSQQPGDLLVITVDESTDVQNRDQRQLDKAGSASTSGSASFGFSGNAGSEQGGLENESESEARRRFNGNTQFRSEREFLDRFTVTILDRLPNGNLLISGRRTINLDGDARILVLSGVVRSIDVTANNTVSSRQIADLDIHLEAEGAESKFLNQGWLGKRFNRAWPF